MREAFAGQMRMQTAQAAKARFADTHAFQIRQHDAVRVADDDRFDITIAIDQHADLAIEFVRKFCELARKFLGDDFARRYAPVIQLFKPLHLIVFKSLNVAFDVTNNAFLQ